MQRFIIALDSFKGCLTSTQANAAVAQAIRERCPNADILQIPLSDGGEGFLDTYQEAIGGHFVEVEACDPLMRPIIVKYLKQGRTAIIESARVCGLNLLKGFERNPLNATSYGLGLIVADAVQQGETHIIVGLGGSATSDCGMGMLQALIDRYSSDGTWKTVHQLDHVNFTIATDVSNPLCGESGAVHVFSPQKGATPEMLPELETRAIMFANHSKQLLHRDCRNMPGAGAAGGLGYFFFQYLHAKRCSGIEHLLDLVHFDQHVQHASMVITGEGTADRQTLMGKLPIGILQRTMNHHVPVILLAGQVKDRQMLLDAGFSNVLSINPVNLPFEEAVKPHTAKQNLYLTIQNLLKAYEY